MSWTVPAINWLTIGNFSLPGRHPDGLSDCGNAGSSHLGQLDGPDLFSGIYAWRSGLPSLLRLDVLFTASMLGLVLANNLLMMFVFWEMVGLCSYLLIGFWFHRPSAANAAKKAFIVTRLGDFGFLAAILILYANTGTFDIVQLRELAVAGTLGGAVLTWAAIGIFAGAAGKSAQFPLHTWLPDAMEGPTPVSALIHAATMVAAGVFLVARTLPLFEHSSAALITVAIIGGFTAIFAPRWVWWPSILNECWLILLSASWVI